MRETKKYPIPDLRYRIICLIFVILIKYGNFVRAICMLKNFLFQKLNKNEEGKTAFRFMPAQPILY